MTTKTITTEQLENLTWNIDSVDCGDHEVDMHEEAIGIDEDENPITETRYNSWVAGTCALRAAEHSEITYTIEWMAQGGRETLEDAYDFEVDVNENADNVLDAPPGFQILDIDGDEIEAGEAVHQISNDIEMSCEWEVEVGKNLPAMPAAELIEDIDEDNDMETIELSRDSGPDVRFQGEEIASASSFEHDGPRNARWTELTLYRTKGGKLVCAEAGRTKMQGERTKRCVHVADTEAELIQALGYGWLAKELYDVADIDHAVTIE